LHAEAAHNGVGLKGLGEAFGEFWTKIRLSIFFWSVSLFFGIFSEKRASVGGVLLDFLMNFLK
jgi:hypothetical protein